MLVSKRLAGLRRRHFSTAPPAAAVDPSTLLRVCTVLFQQQNAPEERLHANLRALRFDLSHEFFLQICNRFPCSWRPLHNLLRYADQSSFPLTPVAVNKLIDVFGKSQNTKRLWDFLNEMASRDKLFNARSILLAVRSFAAGRQIKKAIAVFHLFNRVNPQFCTVTTLNAAIAELCTRRLVPEAKAIVYGLKPLIAPDSTTYSLLAVGFCRSGDLVRASTVWNALSDAGLDPDLAAYNEMISTFFKCNRQDEALAIFDSLRRERLREVDSSDYKTVISWMCKRGRIGRPLMLAAEMIKRGVEIDGPCLGALAYGLLCRRRVKEAYKLMVGADLSAYHGLIKGLVRLRRTSEATQVFREMSQRGIRPSMHTYIMLLQGHMGKRGRKCNEDEANFETIFVGGLVKAGRMHDVTKYIERSIWSGTKVPRFDYNKFLRDFSNEEGVVMFERVGKRLKEAGMTDLGDVFLSYGMNMATRERRISGSFMSNTSLKI
ncbi:pentatricopeptide repeat (PPR) superfamily protein [Wolffia australiana]